MPTTSSTGCVARNTTSPCGALFLSGSHHDVALLLRVGQRFGWAGGGVVVIDAIDGPRWHALGIDVCTDHVQANGLRWSIEQREGNVNS